MTTGQDSFPATQRIRIAGAIVDLSTGDVDFGDREVRLAPRVTDLLAALVARRGEVSSKEDLLSRVWGETFVGDDALWRCMSELRATFEEGGIGSLIETLPRRGYRLLAEVESLSDEVPAPRIAEAPAHSPRGAVAGLRWPAIAGGVAAAVMLALAAGGGRNDSAAAASDATPRKVTEGSLTAAVLAAYSQRQREALAIRRDGGDSLAGMTAAGYDMLIRSSATSDPAGSLAHAADIMFARGRPATALQFYHSAIDAGAADPALRIKARDTLQAVRRTRQLAGSSAPETAEDADREGVLQVARTQRINEDFPGAVATLSTILARDPGDEPALLELVKVHLSLGDLANARETLRRSLDVFPDSVALLSAAAEAELLAGDAARALGFLDRACLAWSRSGNPPPEAAAAARPLLCWSERIGGTADADSGAAAL